MLNSWVGAGVIRQCVRVFVRSRSTPDRVRYLRKGALWNGPG